MVLGCDPECGGPAGTRGHGTGPRLPVQARAHADATTVGEIPVALADASGLPARLSGLLELPPQSRPGAARQPDRGDGGRAERAAGDVQRQALRPDRRPPDGAAVLTAGHPFTAPVAGCSC